MNNDLITVRKIIDNLDDYKIYTTYEDLVIIEIDGVTIYYISVKDFNIKDLTASMVKCARVLKQRGIQDRYVKYRTTLLKLFLPYRRDEIIDDILEN